MKINYTWRSEASEKETLNTRLCRIEPPAPHKQNTKGNEKKETTRRPEESGRKRKQEKGKEKGNWNETRCGSKPSRGREAKKARNETRKKQKEKNGVPPNCSPDYPRSPYSSSPGRLDSNSRRPSAEARCIAPGAEAEGVATAGAGLAAGRASAAAVAPARPVGPAPAASVVAAAVAVPAPALALAPAPAVPPLPA